MSITPNLKAVPETPDIEDLRLQALQLRGLIDAQYEMTMLAILTGEMQDAMAQVIKAQSDICMNITNEIAEATP